MDKPEAPKKVFMGFIPDGNECYFAFSHQSSTKDVPYIRADISDSRIKELEEERNSLASLLKMVFSNNMQFGTDSSKRRILRIEPEQWELIEEALKQIEK